MRLSQFTESGSQIPTATIRCFGFSLAVAFGLSVFAFALPAVAKRGEESSIVVVDMTEAGRKVAPPSPDRPVFYAPLVIGYREEGATFAGEKKPPPQEKVLQQFAKALAQQGYRVASPRGGEPTLLLIFSWGSWNATNDTVPIDATEDETNLPAPGPGELTQSVASPNRREMLALVAGNTLNAIPVMPDYMTNTELDAVRSDAADNRYFAIVAAFDWAAAKEHKRVMLWSAKMSVRSNGVWLDEILPSLIASGGPFFGRETRTRQEVAISALREGKVELGELRNNGIVDEKLEPAKIEPAPEENKKP